MELIFLSGILYIGAFLCFGLFMLVGNGIMELESIVPGMERLYQYLGFMNIGLGLFSGSVLVWLGRKDRIS